MGAVRHGSELRAVRHLARIRQASGAGWLAGLDRDGMAAGERGRRTRRSLVRRGARYAAAGIRPGAVAEAVGAIHRGDPARLDVVDVWHPPGVAPHVPARWRVVVRLRRDGWARPVDAPA